MRGGVSVPATTHNRSPTIVAIGGGIWAKSRSRYHFNRVLLRRRPVRVFSKDKVLRRERSIKTLRRCLEARPPSHVPYLNCKTSIATLEPQPPHTKRKNMNKQTMAPKLSIAPFFSAEFWPYFVRFLSDCLV